MIWALTFFCVYDCFTQTSVFMNIANHTSMYSHYYIVVICWNQQHEIIHYACRSIVVTLWSKVSPCVWTCRLFLWAGSIKNNQYSTQTGVIDWSVPGMSVYFPGTDWLVRLIYKLVLKLHRYNDSIMSLHWYWSINAIITPNKAMGISWNWLQHMEVMVVIFLRLNLFSIKKTVKISTWRGVLQTVMIT